MMKNWLLIILLVVLGSQPLQAKDVIYAAEERDNYYVQLLTLALSYSPEKNYQVKKFPENIPKQRFFHLLAQGDGIDVVKGSAILNREQKYRAVYFPILRGLKGWRVPIINKERPELFRNVKTLEDLKKLTAIQFHSWSTNKIFKANKMKVTRGSDYHGMFQMLNRHRADYLPRSVLEAQYDLAFYPTLNLMLDPYTIIAYPSAFYFYVKKDNEALAIDIKKGLELALKDGSFLRLFERSYGEELKALDIANRNIIHLENPFLPDTVPLKRKELWAHQ